MENLFTNFFQDISSSMGAYVQVPRTVRSKVLSTRIKFKMYKSAIRPIVLYDSKLYGHYQKMITDKIHTYRYLQQHSFNRVPPVISSIDYYMKAKISLLQSKKANLKQNNYITVANFTKALMLNITPTVEILHLPAHGSWCDLEM